MQYGVLLHDPVYDPENSGTKPELSGTGIRECMRKWQRDPEYALIHAFYDPENSGTARGFSSAGIRERKKRLRDPIRNIHFTIRKILALNRNFPAPV